MKTTDAAGEYLSYFATTFFSHSVAHQLDDVYLSYTGPVLDVFLDLLSWRQLPWLLPLSPRRVMGLTRLEQFFIGVLPRKTSGKKNLLHFLRALIECQPLLDALDRTNCTLPRSKYRSYNIWCS